MSLVAVLYWSGKISYGYENSIEIRYQMQFSFAKHNSVFTFLKQQNNFIDLPKVIGFKAHKQREYVIILVTAK